MLLRLENKIIIMIKGKKNNKIEAERKRDRGRNSFDLKWRKIVCLFRRENKKKERKTKLNEMYKPIGKLNAYFIYIDE